MTELIKNAASELSSDIVEQLANHPKYKTFRETIIKFAIKEIIEVSESDNVQNSLSDMFRSILGKAVFGK
jgi:hypothetical protein